MKNLKKITVGVFGIALLTSGLYSCSNDESFDVNENSYKSKGTRYENFDDFFYEKNEMAMKDFSEALSKAMNESSQLRKLIKSEALKKFNNDTEVLVANLVELNIDEGTVAQKLNKFLTNTKIENILNQVPTLTLLIPELPNESFSAEKWDTENDIPMIGIRTAFSNNTPVLETDEHGKTVTDIIPSDLIPGSPILVTKLNERVISSLDVDFSKIKDRSFFTSKITNIDYVFSDIEYNGILNPIKTRPRISNVDAKISTAYELTDSKNDWQRDYIYYDIHTQNPNGLFDYKFKEFLTYFKPIEYNGSAMASYNQFTDHTDPRYNPKRESGNWNYWTDGAYEFEFHFILTKGAEEGNDVTYLKPISVMPDEIFTTEYTHHRKKFLLWTRNWYEISSIKSKQYTANRDIFSWNLKEYGDKMVVQVYERDPAQTVKETISNTSKTATNFGVDFGIDLFKIAKLGLKFGTSQEGTKTYNAEITTTYASDNLGNTPINFRDPVVTGKFPTPNNFPFTIDIYKLNSYTVGGLEFNVMPKRIQN